QGARAEGIRKHLVDRLEPRHRLEDHARGRVLEEQLAAATARHEHVAVAVDAGEGDELAAARHVEARHEGALRAEAHTVRRVLDVAPRDDATVVDERGCPHRKVRVRNVRVELRRVRRVAKGTPVDVVHGYSLRVGWSGSLSFNLT